MSEQELSSPDKTLSPESLKYQEGLVGAQVRFLIGGVALDPKRTDLPSVKQEDLKSLAEHDYSPFNQASTRERLRYWQKRSLASFDDQYRQWEEQMMTILSADKNKKVVEGLIKLQKTSGIEFDHIIQVGLKKFYDRYLQNPSGETITVTLPSGETKCLPSNIKRFVSDILESYKENGVLQYEKLKQDLPSFQWLANVFGETASAVVAQLIDAEAKLQTQPAALINEVNRDNRINTLLPKEKELLQFVWGEGIRQEVVDKDKEPAKKTSAGNKEAEPELERIIEGHGIEEIIEKGWDNFRDKLTRVSYGQMVERQLAQMEALAEKAKTEPSGLTEEELIRQNRAARQRIEQMTTEFLDQYGKDKNLPFFARFSDEKLRMDGKNFIFADEMKTGKITL